MRGIKFLYLLVTSFLISMCTDKKPLNVYESVLRDKEVKLVREGEIRIKETKENFIAMTWSGKVF